MRAYLKSYLLVYFAQSSVSIGISKLFLFLFSALVFSLRLKGVFLNIPGKAYDMICCGKTFLNIWNLKLFVDTLSVILGPFCGHLVVVNSGQN